VQLLRRAAAKMLHCADLTQAWNSTEEKSRRFFLMTREEDVACFLISILFLFDSFARSKSIKDGGGSILLFNGFKSLPNYNCENLLVFFLLHKSKINSETLFSFFRDERERDNFLSSSEKLTKIWFVVVVVVVGHKRETKMKIVKDHKR